MHDWIMPVPNLAEKMYAVCPCEQRRGDRVHRCVAPALFQLIHTNPHSFSSDFEQEEAKEMRLPRSKSHHNYRDIQRTPSRPRHAKSPYRQSQSCSKLFLYFKSAHDQRSLLL